MPTIMLKAGVVWAVARRKRALRLVTYFGLANAGVLAVVYPPESMVTVMGGAVTTVFGWFLIVGGVLSLGGTITDLWLGEYLGLTLVCAAVLTYTVAVFANAPADPRKAAGAMLLGVLFVLLADRWLDVRGTGRGSALVGRHERE